MAATPSHILSFCPARWSGLSLVPHLQCVFGVSGCPCLSMAWSWLWPVLYCPSPSWALCLALAVPGNWVIVQPPDPSAQTLSLLHCHTPQIFTEPMTPPQPGAYGCPGPCSHVCLHIRVHRGVRMERVLGRPCSSGPGSPQWSGQQSLGPHRPHTPGSPGLYSQPTLPVAPHWASAGGVGASACQGPAHPPSKSGAPQLRSITRGVGVGMGLHHKPDLEAPVKPQGPSLRPPPGRLAGGGGSRPAVLAPQGPHTPSQASREGWLLQSRIALQARQSGALPAVTPQTQHPQPSVTTHQHPIWLGTLQSPTHWANHVCYTRPPITMREPQF